MNASPRAVVTAEYLAGFLWAAVPMLSCYGVTCAGRMGPGPLEAGGLLKLATMWDNCRRRRAPGHSSAAGCPSSGTAIHGVFA